MRETHPDLSIFSELVNINPNRQFQYTIHRDVSEVY